MCELCIASDTLDVPTAAPVELVGRTGDDRIDGLLGRTHWTGDEGETTVITYSFVEGASVYGANYGALDEPEDNFQALSTTQREAMRDAFDKWAEVADIRFVELDETFGTEATIRIGRTDASPTAHAYLPSTNTAGGDIWFGPYFSESASYAPGTYRFHAMIHEIGHALGLKHPHEAMGTGDVVPGKDDWLGTSVMSYASYVGDPRKGYTTGFYPTGPMEYDILAIQAVYGVNETFRAGDTVYTFAAGERIFQTIHDAGGDDWIDWSERADSAVIKLDPGEWSKLGSPYTSSGGRFDGTLKIAGNTRIEHARGGSGDDKLIGSDGDNRLEGMSGRDQLIGGEGDDTLVGGAGADRIRGGAGIDTAVIGGLASQFEIRHKKGTVKIASSEDDDGQDKITGVEIIQFDDGELDLSAIGKVKWTNVASLESGLTLSDPPAAAPDIDVLVQPSDLVG